MVVTNVTTSVAHLTDYYTNDKAGDGESPMFLAIGRQTVGIANAGAQGNYWGNNFPIAFKVDCYSIIPVHYGSVASTNIIVYYDNSIQITKEKFWLKSNWNDANAPTAYYIAIGV